jgi:diacylglycerol kinase (ATP)
VKVHVVWNPNAGTADAVGQIREAISRRRGWEVFVSSGPENARDVARSAAIEGVDIVVAAGGDGTINSVVNGIMDAGGRAVLGILPIGTGNDLIRTLDIPAAPDEALSLIDIGRSAAIDLISVTTTEGNVYAINAASGGFSGDVGEVLTPELKTLWGPLAYLIGAASAFPDAGGYAVEFQIDDEDWQEASIFNVIVANGKTVAGGKLVAPLADPTDGFLDVIVVNAGSRGAILSLGAKLLAGNLLDDPLVTWRRARHLAVRPQEEMWFNVDGELVTRGGCEFVCLPGAIRVITGLEEKSLRDAPA